MSPKSLRALSKKAKQLLRSGHYTISEHVLYDNPQRRITAADIIECIKVGEVASLEPREHDGETKYIGADRYRWFGQDTTDRVLRLIVVIKNNLVIVSAVEATENQAEIYRAEDESE